MQVREMKATYEVREIDTGAWYGSRIASSAEAITVIRPIIGDAPDESVWAIYMDGSNQILAVSLIGIGGTNSCNCPTSKVLRNALLCNASCFIVAHNHPSGHATPSAGDRGMTEALVKASRIVEIPLIDHIIVGRVSTYSFADHGLIAEYNRR